VKDSSILIGDHPIMTTQTKNVQGTTLANFRLLCGFRGLVLNS